MHFEKFNIISDRDVQALEETTETILLNLDHIISIKPIRIVTENGVLYGHWIRMSNGKKYRASKIPESLARLISVPKSGLEGTEDLE